MVKHHGIHVHKSHNRVERHRRNIAAWNRANRASSSFRAASSVASSTGHHSLASAFSVASHASRQPSVSVSEAAGFETAQTTRTAVVIRHPNKKVNFRKPHIPHVTKKFREKVERALEKDGKSMHGSFKTISYNFIETAVSAYPLANQRVDVPGAFGTFFQSDAWGAVANVEDWVHQVSVLWNGKTDSQTFRGWNTAGTLLLNTNATVGPSNRAPTASMGSTSLPLTFTVKRAYDVYKIKNNSQRTVHMKVFLCAPKTANTESPGIISPDDGGANVAMVPLLGNPGQVWSRGLADLVRQGVNLSGTTSSTLYQSPLLCPLFKKYYNCNETTFIIEPGQTCEYKVEGPSDLKCDVSNCFTDKYLLNLQKFSRIPMFVSYLDLSYGLTNKFPARGGGVDGELSFERVKYSSFEMPEGVGANINFPTVGSNAIIDENMKNNRFWDLVYSVSPTGTFVREDEENPVDQQPV